MKVSVRGKNLEVTQALREYLEKRVEKLARYFGSPFDIQAVLSVEKENRVVELTCFVEGIVLRGVSSNADMYAAIDLVVDKIVRQIHKYKTRLARRFKKEVGFQPDAFAPEVPVQEETIDVVRRKRFAVRPMSVEEAIMQMNLVGHDFFMFFNADTEIMNVVYRRKNGSYGLIEPEL
ncbi:ribosome hibernation-promoting factor, HPF/YfiA family [uncultured Veillonella sp.]|uniref:ribosome hibernation-promoting factor, HPF/YfiA family n=1 Tax=uncultured Veillonella sp. TaxID=159268 RepID=UPI0025FEB9C4|nr:ribosome-associated translation inhibitor RaiA [uncultured Veillonella sp.]MDY3973378.1 ribosome-associated translation inhibitor RaiA [Veillonella caviae]